MPCPKGHVGSNPTPGTRLSAAAYSGHVEAREEIDALVGFAGRAPGTDAERRAGRHLERRIGEIGRDAKVEATDVWPAWHLAYAFHGIVAIVGSVLAVSQPIVGGALVLAATLLTLADAIGLPPTTRRALGRRASQNLVSREDGDKPGVLVLVAHYDSGLGGAAFGPGVQRPLAALGRRLGRPVGPLAPVTWSLIVLLVCCILRVVGIDASALTVVQFVPTVALIVAVPLFVDVALSGVSPGANDNASGAVTALRLAERHGGELPHFDLWVLFTGSQEALAGGMRAFLRRHRKELGIETTVFINLDEVGDGDVRYTRREGPVITHRSHVQLVDLCEEIAEDDAAGDNVFGARALTLRTMSDAYRARSAGFPAITITCRNELDYVARHHQQTDTPDALDDHSLDAAYAFCGELIERLDAVIGPDLPESGDAG